MRYSINLPAVSVLLIIQLLLCLFPAEVRAFRFVSWGDAQDEDDGGSFTAKTSNQLKTFSPAFTIFNGDLADAGFLTANEAVIAAALSGNSANGIYEKTFLVRGNHDNQNTYPIADWRNYFNIAGKAIAMDSAGIKNFTELSGDLSYSYDFDNSRFLALDLPDGPDDATSAQWSILLPWIDQRLTDAESNNLVHAFIYSHHPFYCLESVHCDCTAAVDSNCIGSRTMALLNVINKHPIVSATFHGDEHLLAHTHISSTRIPGVIRDYEQFDTSPAGTDAYNSNLFPARVDDVDLSSTAKGFATIDVNGPSYTVKFYRVGSSAPAQVLTSRNFTYTKGNITTVPPSNTPIVQRTSTPVPPTPTASAGNAGDANGDGRVDGFDYVIWVTHFGSAAANGQADGDFSGNRIVDGLDYVIWLNNYGRIYTVPTRTPTSASSSWWKPLPDRPIHWQWQIGTVFSYPSNLIQNVTVYDIDGFNTSVSTVTSLHGQGLKAICYISAGTWEDWRPDASSFPSLVKGNSNGWPGEKWLDIRSSAVRDIMKARLDMCKAKGFDAVEPDNIDGYSNSTGFPLTATDQISFNRFLAAEAHARGMSVMLKNDVDQIGQLVGDFDMALNEECYDYNECSGYRQFVGANKAVFITEYNNFSGSTCSGANTEHFNLIYRDLDLTAAGVRTPCIPDTQNVW